MNKFWNWIKNEETGESELYLDSAISDETWFGDEITPANFKAELAKHSGNVTVWINSPGGDCFAASQIYTMLKNHNGKITVKIDGIAASAASVVAMAGDEVLISPTGMLMIHNPMTVAAGNRQAMEKAIDLLEEVKQSIINAYETKSSLSRAKISQLMDDETWLNAKKAKQMGFVDGILFENNQKSEGSDEKSEEPKKETSDEQTYTAMQYSAVSNINSFIQKVSASAELAVTGTPIVQLDKRLELLKL